ncbi:Protein GVQW1 [Plecturocebus cupreus]
MKIGEMSAETEARKNALCKAKADGSLEARSLRSAWPTWRNPLSTKNTRISQLWWWAPVIGRLRLQSEFLITWASLSGCLSLLTTWQLASPRLSVARKQGKSGKVLALEGSTIRPAMVANGRPTQVNHLRSGVRDQTGQHGENPRLLKIQKLARHGSACLQSFALVAQARAQWCNLGSLQPPPPGFNDSPASAFRLAGITEIGFLQAGQAGLELLTSDDSPTSASQSAGITGKNKGHGSPKKEKTNGSNPERMLETQS